MLLEDRPPEGLWGGLASLPMFDTCDEALAWAHTHLNADTSAPEPLPAYDHAFTHFDLTLHPLILHITTSADAPDSHRWYDPQHPPRIGLTKPTVDLLKTVSVMNT